MKSALFVLGALCALSFAHGELAGDRGRIVGGVPAKKKYQRGMALIYGQYDGGDPFGLCTSTIIGDRWLLSAAHCFYDREDGLWYGAVPMSKYADVRDSSDLYEAKNVWVYKKYDTDGFKHDIAIVELKKRIKRGSYTRVRLVAPPRDGKTVMAAGYGQLGEDGPSAKVLMQTRVVYRKFSWCINNEGADEDDAFWDKKVLLCAVSVDFPAGKTDTCYGDSGGPLFSIKGGRRLEQFAVTSFSNGECAEKWGTPWYVRAQFFKRDIRNLMRGKRGTWVRYRK